MEKKRAELINRLYYFISLLVILFAAAKLAIHLEYWLIAVIFSGIGLISSLWNRSYSLLIFFFLLPFINATPGWVNPAYPFNYIAPSLFLLSGMILVPLLKSIIKPENSILELPRNFNMYLWFLLFLLLSFIFVWLRWSNITFRNFAALGADTLVSTGEKASRVSFAAVFPVVSLFIYFISPYIYVLVRRSGVTIKDCFKWISFGFIVSVGLAVQQRLNGSSLISDRLDKELPQFYGGFSDFNAFGFFSGVMMLWSTREIKKRNPLGYTIFLVALAGGILSGSRTMFFFMAAAIFNLFRREEDRETAASRTASGQNRKWIVISMVTLLLLVVIFMGGTMLERLGEGFDEKGGTFEKFDSISNGRLKMTLFSLEIMSRHFFNGVGIGNFSFYLDYKHSNEKGYLYDLSLNQYTLVFTENGVFACLFFLLFLFSLIRRSKQKLLLGMILFSLLFNNFFWFPEAFLIFWILAALYEVDNRESGEEKENGGFLPAGLIQFIRKYQAPLLGIALMIFLLFNLLQFNALHPVTWTQETGQNYDYGFWYRETGADGRAFHWTQARAGLMVHFDKKQTTRRFAVSCGAPLLQLPGKNQKVSLYWKGKPVREINFTHNREVSFTLSGRPGERGFLEIDVKPMFNLEKMKLGAETRDLGVMFFRERSGK